MSTEQEIQQLQMLQQKHREQIKENRQSHLILHLKAPHLKQLSKIQSISMYGLIIRKLYTMTLSMKIGL